MSQDTALIYLLLALLLTLHRQLDLLQVYALTKMADKSGANSNNNGIAQEEKDQLETDGASGSKLTDHQRARIERNRQRAVLLRQARYV